MNKTKRRTYEVQIICQTVNVYRKNHLAITIITYARLNQKWEGDSAQRNKTNLWILFYWLQIGVKSAWNVKTLKCSVKKNNRRVYTFMIFISVLECIFYITLLFSHIKCQIYAMALI